MRARFFALCGRDGCFHVMVVKILLSGSRFIYGSGGEKRRMDGESNCMNGVDFMGGGIHIMGVGCNQVLVLTRSK